MGTARQWNEGGHAIVSATFAVDFQPRPLPQQTVRELLALHPKFVERFPRKSETTGFLLGIPAGTAEDVQFQPEIGRPVLDGFAFDYLQPSGEVLRAIKLNEGRLSIARSDYIGWDKTWGEVRKDLALMLSVALPTTNVIAFHLQYHDRFVWDGDRSEFTADRVFRRENDLLVPNSFKVRDLWHSHHGYFEYPDQPEKHQLLHTIQVQVVPPGRVGLSSGDGLGIDLRLNHRVYHGVERAGQQPRLIKRVEEVFGPSDAGGLIDAYINEMHDKNKALLARLINDEMCDRIGLERPR